jgi:hypothetical protein
MKIKIEIMKRCSFTALGLVLILVLPLLSTPVWADDEPWKNPYLERTFLDEEGREIVEVIIPGLPPGERISEFVASDIEIMQADAVLSDVPAFDWCYGCSATSAAMLFGYYDRTGYPNMYVGSTNGGVCPLDNSAWGTGECSLSATHQGYDGLTAKGHVDDYWFSYGSTVDPYDGYWTEHGYADCTADFMGTNQYVNWLLNDGATRFFYYPSGARLYDYTGQEYLKKRDGCHGMRLFAQSRGYTVVQNYNQLIDPYVSGGFSFNDFKAEIDAGRPVLIHSRSETAGHTMLGYGYDDPNRIWIHDTWSHTDHWMIWGGSYGGLQHYLVTAIKLEPAAPPFSPVITSCTLAGDEMNQFAPGESVYAKGSGLEATKQYKIWIQDDAVGEGDSLTTGEDDSGTQEGVNTDGSGSFGPTAIWAIPGDASVTHDEYDIVVDKQSDEGNTGKFNSGSDGIDAMTAVGFVAPVPELPAILLFSLGLLVLMGYVVVRKEKKEE